ncbi:alkaline phosphatase family protein [Phenylobacterium kunshanense]|uniref:Phosphoglyceromutase n=1 Tax=Phenylobacterium kunshanense TaxID=1445034 RepID=A0A328BP66_9CAUL|nr:alkaline phosphatase family protein [Phenylobacterium kunshanense]RAK67714.1 phosphoglyceromutase [Phenylobacterium kunshanense]
MRGAIILIAWLLALLAPASAGAAERRLVLVTLDGLDWTEVFRGADPQRAADKAFVHEAALVKPFVEAADRRRALMPFLADVVGRQGVLIGDRDHGSCMAVANDKWFSYPGYNEILTGRPDPAITSNEHGPNRNVTVLEWLNRRPEFAGRVQAVGSWRTFRDIINPERSGVPVNAGWEDAPTASPAEAAIARMQQGAPRIWATVRLDMLTHAYALEALKRTRPKVLYIAYGETDDFAHEGRYDLTLGAAQRTDAFIAELWRTLQSDPDYAGRTTLIVTTDHGRGKGKADAWKHHGRPIFAESDATWTAIIGPDIAPGAQVAGCAGSNQIAATALKALGVDWRAYDPAAGAPLEIFR